MWQSTLLLYLELQLIVMINHGYFWKYWWYQTIPQIVWLGNQAGYVFSVTYIICLQATFLIFYHHSTSESLRVPFTVSEYLLESASTSKSQRVPLRVSEWLFESLRLWRVAFAASSVFLEYLILTLYDTVWEFDKRFKWKT